MANEEHVAKLNEGVQAWNNWCEENKYVRPDLSDADLSRADLSRADLSGADLDGADLTEANLCGAYLGESDLSGAELKGADLSGAELRNAKLPGVDLRGANFRGAYLGKAELLEADLTEANLSLADLSESDLRRANLRGADLENVILKDAALRNADLRGAILRGARFKNADLRGAELYDADLLSANLHGVFGLVCNTLRTARNWQFAFRDEELECGDPNRYGLEKNDDKGDPSADTPVEPGAQRHYDIVIGPDDRPTILPNRIRFPTRRSDVTWEQQLEAANDLEASIKELVANAQKAISEHGDAAEKPGIGHNQPPGTFEIHAQLVAEADTAIAQSRAPVPDLTVFQRFKMLVTELGPLIQGGIAIIAAVIVKIEFFLSLFGI